MLAAGLLLRFGLLPLAQGPDFTTWEITAAYLLGGHDPYSNPPPEVYSTGPYAYLPLYLYVLAGLKWLAEATRLSFRVLGKLPVVVADLVVSVAVARSLAAAGCSRSIQTAGAALFALNPLVLYNGAWYGRFDSLCLAPLVLAWPAAAAGRGDRVNRRLAGLYALAVVLKTFPAFLAPYLVLRRDRRAGLVAIGSALLLAVAVSLPFLLHDAPGFLRLVLLYNTTKDPRQFSWQAVFPALGLPGEVTAGLGYLLLVILGLALAALAWRARLEPQLYAALAFSLFLLLSKVTYEQYFLWPLPFLVVIALRDRNPGAWVAVAGLSLTGLTSNLWFHPFGDWHHPPLWLDGLVAAVLLVFVLSAPPVRGRLTAGRRPKTANA